MKLSHAAFGLVAMSVTPLASAFAQSPSAEPEGRPYAIRIISDASPAQPEELRYPTLAASKGLSGSCSLKMDVGANGVAREVEVLNCSSPLFRDAAMRTANRLHFAHAERTGMQMQIRWEMPSVDSQLARLD